jgi:hypothetical protein
MGKSEIHVDYQNVYKAMANNQKAKESIELKYGKIENMGDLYQLGAKLFDLLTNLEKKMDLTETVLSLRSIDETKKQNNN